MGVRDLGLEKEFRDIIFKPMSEFIEAGFLYILNRDYMIPRGMYIGVYLDDDTNEVATGWTCIPYETALRLGVVPSLDDIDLREKAFEEFVC